MADKQHTHWETVPTAIDSLVSRLGELQVVIGAQAAPVIEAVRAGLLQAMAARDRGDVGAATRQIGDAMDRLANLAEQLDPAEAMMMRALAQRFKAALLRGDTSQAKADAAVMFSKSGAQARDKK